jgi:hypothetical protein
MTVKKKRSSDWIVKVDRELEKWSGVEAYREFPGNKHNRLIITYGDQSRFVIYPSSPGKCRKAILNHLQDVRRVLRELGAQRTNEKTS